MKKVKALINLMIFAVIGFSMIAGLLYLLLFQSYLTLFVTLIVFCFWAMSLRTFNH